jgi:hypothetical protein
MRESFERRGQGDLWSPGSLAHEYSRSRRSLHVVSPPPAAAHRSYLRHARHRPGGLRPAGTGRRVVGRRVGERAGVRARGYGCRLDAGRCGDQARARCRDRSRDRDLGRRAASRRDREVQGAHDLAAREGGKRHADGADHPAEQDAAVAHLDAHRRGRGRARDLVERQPDRPSRPRPDPDGVRAREGARLPHGGVLLEGEVQPPRDPGIARLLAGARRERQVVGGAHGERRRALPREGAPEPALRPLR